jgi:SAM-dependent methyltransferase
MAANRINRMRRLDFGWWRHQRRRAARLRSLTDLDIRGPEFALNNPHLSAKLLSPAHGDVVVEKPQGRGPGLPVPPVAFWDGYGFTEEQYLEAGREHTEAMLAILRAAGADPASLDRVLEFGCAGGRMLRWFPAVEGTERWGVDIRGESIAWCQQHLSPPMLFAANTTLPHLPFEDGYFDLVYCGSVFTHIIDLPDTWMLELRRVTRPGGFLYVTISDKHTVELALGHERNGGSGGDAASAGATSSLAHIVEHLRALDARTGALGTDFAYISTDAGKWEGLPVPQVVYDRDYITARWSRLVELVSATPEAYWYQTALLFRKR